MLPQQPGSPSNRLSSRFWLLLHLCAVALALSLASACGSSSSTQKSDGLGSTHSAAPEIASVNVVSSSGVVTCTVTGTNFGFGLSARIYSNGALLMTLSGSAQVSNLAATSFTVANLSFAMGDYTMQVRNADGTVSNNFVFEVAAS